MKERPILFSAPMVRAILAGQKTQTRRVVKLPSDAAWHDHMHCILEGFFFDYEGLRARRVDELPCPYGQPGDRLWVRETWRYDATGRADGGDVVYAADCARLSVADLQGRWDWGSDEPPDPPRATPIWRPSIHMPRWASRITLEITETRAERLHDIITEGAIREGVESRAAFADLWASINGAKSWEANPWVWVVNFRRLEAP